MPLIHSKSPNAFSKNVATEMHEGKPQKQAVAIAYSEQRHANRKKMSMGGECIGPSCGGCSAENCYSEGGQVMGVHPDQGAFGGKAGQSPAGESVRKMKEGTYKEFQDVDPKIQHQKRLDELKTMKKPHGNYAEGGEVTEEPDNLDAIGKDDMDDELHDMLGSEILGAIEAKDHKMIWSGLEALVLSIMNKE